MFGLQGVRTRVWLVKCISLCKEQGIKLILFDDKIDYKTGKVSMLYVDCMDIFNI